jgi:hypothetical protein
MYLDNYTLGNSFRGGDPSTFAQRPCRGGIGCGWCAARSVPARFAF